MWGPMSDSISCHCSHYAGPISDSSGFTVVIMRGPMSDSSICHCSHYAGSYV